VHAIDNDPAAIEATLENAAVNHVSVDARVTDATTVDLLEADVTVANISLDGVNALRPDSELVVTSGYLVSDEPTLPGYEHVRRHQSGGWAADLHRRRQ
jgi:ribosomal protein L11 methylase PrmA